MTGPSSAAGRYSRRPVGLQGSSSSQPVLQMPQADEPSLTQGDCLGEDSY